MDTSRFGIACVVGSLCLFSVRVEATSLAELQERFSLYAGMFSGELRDQIEVIQQELAYCVRVEAKNPWKHFIDEMLKTYPFLYKTSQNPQVLFFPKEGPNAAATKSEWWTEHCGILLAQLETIKNSAEVENLSDELQNLFLEATIFIQATQAENQRIHLAEEEELERQRAEIDLEAYTASIPEELRSVFTYLQNLERGTIDPYADVAEMLEKQVQFMKWQTEWQIEPLTPFLPKKADREQFLKTGERIMDEAVADL